MDLYDEDFSDAEEGDNTYCDMQHSHGPINFSSLRLNV